MTTGDQFRCHSFREPAIFFAGQSAELSMPTGGFTWDDSSIDAIFVGFRAVRRAGRSGRPGWLASG